MKKLNMVIVGHGFVGKAVDYGFNNHSCEKTIIDPIYESTLENTKDINADISFVCVPTPMGKDGKIDSSIVIDTVKKLKQRRTGIIVIKSTVTPNVIKELTKGQTGKRVLYNPEFLTEKNANEDFVNPKMHILGGDPEQTKKLEIIYNEYSLCKPCTVYHMKATEASFVKYGINCFLASKVLWFNQFYDVVENFGDNFGKIINAVGTDPRIGQSHSRVPGFDGKRGFGGACFPKDTSAFSNFAQTFTVLDKVIEENNNYRKDYDKDERELAQNVTYD
jgi:UDPglucose 6-dehydrogenase